MSQLTFAVSLPPAHLNQLAPRAPAGELGTVVNKNQAFTKMAILGLVALSLSGCLVREAKPDKPEGIYRVDLRPKDGTKTLHLRVYRYVGLPGPEGWVGWEARGCSLEVPMGPRGHVVNPKVEGTDGPTYGYVNLDEKAKTIDVHLREGTYERPPGWWDADNKGTVKDLRIKGDEEFPYNGLYHVDNPDAFK